MLGYETSTWHSVQAPRGTPAAIVAKLNQAIVSAIRTPEFRERFVALGTEPIGSSSEQLRAQIAQEVPRWERVLGGLGLRGK